MTSRWEHVKTQAIAARKKGDTLPNIEERFGIPRSTLNGWFKTIIIPDTAQKKISMRKASALADARIKANAWHRLQKENRLIEAQSQATEMLSRIDMSSKDHLEIALAFLYLGEGTKKSVITALGNSDPRILKFFVAAIHRLYDVPIENFKCDLHLRADQDSDAEKKYWSHTLGIPMANFSKSVTDKRTIGSVTYSTYHGVCVVRCSRVALQRKLMYIAHMFCDSIAEQTLG